MVIILSLLRWHGSGALDQQDRQRAVGEFFSSSTKKKQFACHAKL
jgi:hypothetical protein